MTSDQERFDQILEELLDEENGSTLLAIPGIYEVVSEHFNNEVLSRMDIRVASPGSVMIFDDFDECAECRGWAHFNVGTDREGIERCDNCQQFEDDDAAARAHDLHCKCGAGADRRAQRCHQCGAERPFPGYWAGRGLVEKNDRLYCSECNKETEGD